MHAPEEWPSRRATSRQNPAYRPAGNYRRSLVRRPPGAWAWHVREGSLTKLAALLWNARRLGGVVDPAACELPRTKDEAYAIQDEIVALSGHERRGYKVGSTSVEAQRLLGTDEPGAGVLLAPYVHDSPARVRLTPAHMPAVEGEFAFQMARDLPPRASAYTLAEVDAAVESVAGAIEVVGTRFAGGLAGKGRL